MDTSVDNMCPSASVIEQFPQEGLQAKYITSRTTHRLMPRAFVDKHCLPAFLSSASLSLVGPVQV